MLYSSFAATIPAPLTATLIITALVLLLNTVALILSIAVVPVTNVTLGFVPGLPESVGVYEVLVVVPIGTLCAPIGVMHTHTEPL